MNRFDLPAVVEKVAKAIAAEFVSETWEELSDKVRCNFRAVAQAAITAMLEAVNPYEEAAQVVDKWAAYYPEEIFIPDSKTPDSIAAMALRIQLPKIAHEIRGLIAEDTTVKE